MKKKKNFLNLRLNCRIANNLTENNDMVNFVVNYFYKLNYLRYK